MNFIIDPLKNLDSYKKLIKDIEERKSPISLYGIVDESIGYIAHAIEEDTKKQIIILTHNELRGKIIYEDIKNLTNKKVKLLEKKEILFYDADFASSEKANDRLSLIKNLIQGEELVVVGSLDAFLDKVLNEKIFKDHSYFLKPGEILDLDNFKKKLLKSGYDRVAKVEGKGQFSIRGGIIDIYAPSSKNPYRIELFDDEVDSIRAFDILTQRSIDNKKEIRISPAKEILILDKYRQDIIEKMENEMLSGQEKDISKRRVEKFSKIIEDLKENIDISNRDIILPFIPEKYLDNLFSYFNDDTIIFMDDPSRIRNRGLEIEGDFQQKHTDLMEVGEVLPSHINTSYTYLELLPYIEEKICIMTSELLRSKSEIKAKAIYNFSTKAMPPYYNKMNLLKEDLNYYKYRGYKIIIFSGSNERGQRLKSSLFEMGINTSFIRDENIEIKSSQIFITPRSIEAGFEYTDIKLILISDKEVFGRSKKRRKAIKDKRGKKIASFTELNVGDYIVHENHGIGKYEGVERLDIQGIKKDYMTISYRGEDKLYVPIDQMNLIQKYIGKDAIKPKINKLNSSEWIKTKAKAKRAVEEMAEDLIELYAKREKLEGYQFSKDSNWQREFEDLFPYEETNPQLRSIEEIKKDMEDKKPMDRLLCGDVGYGKTEVALRAAFKAVSDGKQVAFLVPTTILAKQHYNTIMERFSTFPINVGMLSRFVSPAKQKVLIESLRRGETDIVIGTHRILSKDLKFKDLGLLIIDEEQRFGVKHKEILKKIKENVDVLTLTATPIPRTLHMSMVGIRDMSLIDEPPEERYPVQTYVVEYKEQMIRDAILKELSRGGQVYFVYNRVGTIDSMTSKLKKLVPEANFAIAHGQMGERKLEKVMVDFLEREYDVLVCTTIIETGLDIPNVNTMIIYDADKMGLSQLYQLRGRVGRSDRIAYGYFTYEENKVLSQVASKRLRAIKEFSEFGSGFKIAMRDLEIRGAGNLLGLSQHGHIESIGYDLYVKYLENSLKKLKGEKVEETLDTSIDINIDGFIPKKYIKDEEQKIEIYKKISFVEKIDDRMELIDELVDRFGDLPKEVDNLINVSYIKNVASKNYIKNIIEKNKGIVLEFVSNDSMSMELLNYLSKNYHKKIKFNPSKTPSFTFNTNKNKLEDLKGLVDKINSFNKDKNEI